MVDFKLNTLPQNQPSFKTDIKKDVPDIKIPANSNSDDNRVSTKDVVMGVSTVAASALAVYAFVKYGKGRKEIKALTEKLTSSETSNRVLTEKLKQFEGKVQKKTITNKIKSVAERISSSSLNPVNWFKDAGKFWKNTKCNPANWSNPFKGLTKSVGKFWKNTKCNPTNWSNPFKGFGKRVKVSKFNPQNWHAVKFVKSHVTPKKWYKNITRNFKAFSLKKQHKLRLQESAVESNKKTIGSRLKEIFSRKKNVVNNQQNLSQEANSVVQNKESLWSKGRKRVTSWWKNYKENSTQAKLAQRSRKVKAEFNNSSKTNQETRLKRENEIRKNIFDGKSVNINKTSEKINNLYNTIVKYPERLTGKIYENDMTRLCDSIGHRFDTIKTNPNALDNLIKKYGNKKHLTQTLTMEEIDIAKKLEAIFTKFKEIQFSKL